MIIAREDKPMPSELDAERMIIGVVLLDNKMLTQARERLKPEDFYFPSHRTMYIAMCAMADSGHGIDPLTLQAELRRNGNLDQIGGAAYIASTFDGVPRFSDIRNYARLVKDASAARQLINAGRLICNTAFDGEQEASDQLALARRTLEQIQDPADSGRWSTSGSAVTEWHERYLKRLASGRPYDGLATGLVDLDEHLSGASKSDVTLIAARPGLGKTALLAAIAEKAPRSPYNLPDLVVGIFSLELTKDQWMARWAAGNAGVHLRRLRGAELNKEEKRNLEGSMRELSAMRVFIDDQSSLSPASFRAAVQRLQKDHPGCEVLTIIDYVQMMRGDGKYHDKRTEVTDISHRLKEVVKDYLDCYCIAAASMNRMPEARRDNRPQLSDLRESGDLESDAATVILLHRPSLAQDGFVPSSNEKVEAIIAKGRFCGPGTVDLGFDNQCVRFGDYVREGNVKSWRDWKDAPAEGREEIPF